jgi:NAD(P)H-dependent FMN reductase
MSELSLGVILGSTRPGRIGEAVAKWVVEKSMDHGGAQYELVDRKDCDLPLLDEPHPPRKRQYTKNEWANKVAGFVGYGAVHAVRSIEHRRQILAAQQVATVRTQVGVSLFTDFEEMKTFTLSPHHEQPLQSRRDAFILWAEAFKLIRENIH